MLILLLLTTPCTTPSWSLSASTVITASWSLAGQNRNADTGIISVPGHWMWEACIIIIFKHHHYYHYHHHHYDVGGLQQHVDNSDDDDGIYRLRLQHPVGAPVVGPVVIHNHQPQFAIVRPLVRTEEQVVVQPRLLARVHIEE